MESRTKEPHIEGVANHNDPESGTGDREVTGEASDRGTGRRSIEPRKFRIQGADVVKRRYELYTLSAVVQPGITA